MKIMGLCIVTFMASLHLMGILSHCPLHPQANELSEKDAWVAKEHRGQQEKEWMHE